MADYTDVLATYNFTNLPHPITQDGSGYYDISFTILDSTSVDTQSYGSNSDYYDPSGVPSEEASPSFFSTPSTPQINAITDILLPSDYYANTFSTVSPIDFSSAANGAIAIGQVDDSTDQNLFINPDTGLYDNAVAALTFNGVSPIEAEYGDVWLNPNFTPSSTSNPIGIVHWTTVPAGGVQYFAILHELGHAMGLDHPTGGETQQYTIMSNVPDPDMGSGVYPSGLQLFDVLAIQSKYGINWGTRPDDTLYSVGHGFGATASKAFIYTIWDGAGTDVIDATGYGGSQIDLRQGHFSSIGLQTDSGTAVVFDTPASGGTDEIDHGNVAIAYYAIIENAIGGNSNDTLIGNEWNNVLYGAGGNDTIYGDGITYDNVAGNHAENLLPDRLGHDYFWGPDDVAPAANLSGDDILIGGAGDDYFYGGLGNDIIHGGYVAADITGVVSGWDPAGEFTGTNNYSGVALSNIAYASDGYDSVDYSKLPDGTDPGTGIHATFSVGGGLDLISVEKGYSDEYGIDALFSIEQITGTKWNDTFDGTADYVAFIASGGVDEYSFGSGTVDRAIYYQYLDALSGHIAVTVGSVGGTVDKLISGVSDGVDTVGTGIHTYVGTSGDDSFSGMLPGNFVRYSGGDGNDTYTFDMNDAVATPTSATVFENLFGALSNVLVQHYDSESFISFAFDALTSVSTINTEYYKWDAAIGANDVFDLTFVQSGSTSIQTTTIGSTIFAFGTGNDDTFTAATGAHAIYGAAGTDTVDYGAATGGVTANLSTGTATNNGWGYSDTFVGIQNVIGSSHNDVITGDSNNNVIAGMAGNDTMDGGSGTDTIDYGAAAAGVTVNLATGTASNDGYGSSDTLSNFENITGSAFNDNLTGDANANVINGGAGNDTLVGGAGNDSLDGGSGTDTVDFSTSGSAVTVNLLTGTATGDGTDTLTNIENVKGSSNDGDTLIGNSGDNTLDGGTGNLDTVTYQFASSGVTVNLSTGTATGDGNDTLVNIGVAIGTQYNDTMIGPGNLYGLAGNDTLEGGTIHYNLDPAGVTVNLVTGTATDGWGNTDTLISVHNVTGSAYDDTIIADASAGILFGFTGNDTYVFSSGFGNTFVSENPTSGTDTIHFTGIDPSHIRMYTDSNGFLILQDTTNPSTFITVLAGKTGSGTDESTIGQRVEQITFDDVNNTVWSLTGGLTLTGTTSAETLYGTAFGDVINGMGGTDTIYGNGGNDTISSGSGTDILDGGTGTDTVSYAGATAAVTVNLATTSAQNTVGAGTDTLTNFENLTGSGFADTLTGDGNANVIDGGAGNDVMNGAGGTDTLSYANATAGITINLNVISGQATGGSGTDTISNFENLTGSGFADTLTGDANANTISGGAGNDIIAGRGGADVLDGGTGTDTVDYSAAAAGVTVNLATGTASNDGDGSSDTFTNFENITGSAFNDTLTGDANANTISGGAGNDIIAGRGGADVLDGGTGTDTVDYSAAAAGVTVNLGTGTASNDGDGSSDTLTNFENITGSAFNDNLTGNGNANVIEGLAGNDVMVGGLGTDTVTYVDATSAVTVSLATTSAQNTVGAGTDTISGFENLTGSAFADTLTGDANANTISGGAGNDIIAGRGGADVLDGGTGTDTVDYSAAAAGVTVNLATGTASNDGDGSSDTLTNFENITGSAFADTLTGDGNNNVIDGGPGTAINDVMNGGGGTDTVTYISATAGVTVSLATTSAQVTGGAGTDTISLFENLTGSVFNDTLTGDTNANVIQGLAGNDSLSGGAMNDTLDGGAGTDTATFASAAGGVTVDLSAGTATGDGSDTLISIENVTGSTHNDTIISSSGDNVLDGGNGTDTVSYASAASSVTVNLSTGTATGDGTDTLSHFENITGSAYDDNLTGDLNANIIDGGAGNDIIQGGLGNDVLTGGTGTDTVTYAAATAGVTVNLTTTTGQNTVNAGTDTITGFENLTGSAFADTLTGDANANVIDGGAGSDVMNGAGGTDTLSYASATAGITISLAIATAQVTGGSGSDTISNFENLTGSAFADTLTGDSNNNVIEGLANNDVLVGGLGTDTVTYVDAASAVTVSLALTSAQNTVGAGTDTISGFENLTGSAFNDTLSGNDSPNLLQGLAGNDLLAGGGGNDTFDGGTGTDTATFAAATAGVTVDLFAGTATGQGSDTLISIENATGSTHNDTIISSSGDNVLDGGAGTDTVSFASAASHVTVNLSTGAATGDGTDTISNFENVIGSAYNDTITGDTNVNTLTGGAGDDTITGGGGADLLYGGTGADTFLFLAASAFSAIAKIQDFTSGSGNDKIDLKDVISSYDPATMAITDWVQITTVGSDSVVKVDIDGTGTAHTWQQIATIVGVTGLTDEAALVASGNLVVH